MDAPDIPSKKGNDIDEDEQVLVAYEEQLTSNFTTVEEDQAILRLIERAVDAGKARQVHFDVLQAMYTHDQFLGDKAWNKRFLALFKHTGFVLAERAMQQDERVMVGIYTEPFVLPLFNQAGQIYARLVPGFQRVHEIQGTRPSWRSLRVLRARRRRVIALFLDLRATVAWRLPEKLVRAPPVLNPKLPPRQRAPLEPPSYAVALAELLSAVMVLYWLSDVHPFFSYFPFLPHMVDMTPPEDGLQHYYYDVMVKLAPDYFLLGNHPRRTQARM
jgi:hypothetical protein